MHSSSFPLDSIIAHISNHRLWPNQLILLSSDFSSSPCGFVADSSQMTSSRLLRNQINNNTQKSNIQVAYYSGYFLSYVNWMKDTLSYTVVIPSLSLGLSRRAVVRVKCPWRWARSNWCWKCSRKIYPIQESCHVFQLFGCIFFPNDMVIRFMSSNFYRLLDVLH